MSSLSKISVIVLGILLFCNTNGHTDELKILREQIERLTETQQSMLQYIRQLNASLQEKSSGSKTERPVATLTMADRPMLGSKSAKVTILEFLDYQCPHCRSFFRETFPRINEEYIKTGKVRYVLGDFPIQHLHPRAIVGAQAAHCAGDQGKHWEMRERLFASQKNMSTDDLLRHASALALDGDLFTQCLNSGKYADRVQAELAGGRSAGVRGTPTFFVGLTDMDDKQMRSQAVIRGAQPFSVFKEIFERLLADQMAEAK